MKKYLTRILMVLLILGFTLPLSTISADPTAVDTLVILHPHSSAFADHVIDEFKIWYLAETGNTITVTQQQKYSGDCWADVETWNGTNPEADVWWGGGEYYFKQAATADLLSPYNVTEDGNVTESLGGWPLKVYGDTNESLWYAAAMSGFGIIYNTEYLTAESLSIPTTWADLADPDYFGHISMTDPDLSGSTVAIVKQVLIAMADDPSSDVTMAADITDAWQLWVKIAANIDTFTSGSSKTPAAVAEGNYGIGLCIDYYARDYMKNTTYSYIGFNYGGATTVSPDPAGIIKGATNLDEAKKFMDFLIGSEGQTLVGDYRTPANFKANSSSHIPLAFNKTGHVNVADFPVIDPYSVYVDGKVHSRAEALFHYWLVEPHTELKRAWKQINTMTNATEKEAAIATLVELPSDFNGTFAGLRGLSYSDSDTTSAWTKHGKTQFNDAFTAAGGSLPAPGFEIMIAIISLIFIIPLARKKK